MKSLLLGAALGILALPLLLMIVLRIGVWFLKRKLVKWAESIPQMAPTPISITLDPVDSTSMQLLEDASAIGAYSVRGMRGVMVHAWLANEKDCFIAYYHHPQVGNWWDVVSLYGDGTSCCFSSAPETGLQQRPGHPNHKIPAASREELLSSLRSQRPPAPLTLVGADFVPHFQKAYRDEMEWRAAKGTAYEEVRAVAALGPVQYSQPEVVEATSIRRQNEQNQLIEHLTEVFRSQNSLTLTEWDQVRDDLVFLVPTISENPEDPPLVLARSGAAFTASYVQGQGRRLGVVEIAPMADLTTPTPVPVYFCEEAIQQEDSE